MKISFIVGTRPELIKVAPIIKKFQKENFEMDIVNTAQHKDLLDPYWDTFEIKPTHVLNVMSPSQNLSSLTSRAILEIQLYLDQVSVRPDLILSQGDTTTVMASSIVSYYNNIPFFHLEAGLRSFDLYNPFPEELNRKIASISSSVHLCPTEQSKQNLLREGVNFSDIYVVGNSVIDSIKIIMDSMLYKSHIWKESKLVKINEFKHVVLITSHRRENQGANLVGIVEAISFLANAEEDTIFVWPLHPNPNVKEVVLASGLSNIKNILLTDPLEYLDLLKLLELSFCAISDSGGIQEEAPSLKTPVIVLRDTTERPEGIDLGYAFLCGADKDKIIERYNFLKTHKIDFTHNPYGDGQTSERVYEIVKERIYKNNG